MGGALRVVIHRRAPQTAVGPIDRRTDPPFHGDERATLTGFPRYQRETLEMKYAGLSGRR